MDSKPRPPRCKPETPGAFSYGNIWYKYDATKDESVESEIAAVQSMLYKFVQSKRGVSIGSSARVFRVNFTASSGRVMRVMILYHTYPFTVDINIDDQGVIMDKSSDAHYIKTLIEKVIGE